MEFFAIIWRRLLLYVGWRFWEGYYDALALAMLSLDDLATLWSLDYDALVWLMLWRIFAILGGYEL